MTDTETWLRLASECGFSGAAVLDPKTLTPMAAVRDMCARDKCGAYGRNWTCPPACGTLEECTQKIRGYSRGVLLQTVGTLAKTIDTRGYARFEQEHSAHLAAFARMLRAEHPSALCLGAGGCRVCPKCAYPEPCRFPEQAMSSMEAYGLFVTQVCRDNSLPYYYGEKTIAYTACILF